MVFTKKQRVIVYNKYNGHCGYCGKKITLKQMQIDHINPKSLRTLNMALFEGQVIDNTDHIDNLMPSCRQCNHYKRAGNLEDFRQLMKSLHERLVKIYIVKVAVDYGIITIQQFDSKFYFEKITKNLCANAQ